MNETQQRLAAYAAFFESLTPARLPAFDTLCSAEVRFKDPFNDVRGVQAVKQVFAHLFEQCEHPRFQVEDCCGADARGYLQWTLHFTLGGGSRDYLLRGLSRVRFDADGRVCEHIDYWDPAEQLYRHWPLLGGVLALLRRRLSANAGR